MNLLVYFTVYGEILDISNILLIGLKLYTSECFTATVSQLYKVEISIFFHCGWGVLLP